MTGAPPRRISKNFRPTGRIETLNILKMQAYSSALLCIADNMHILGTQSDLAPNPCHRTPWHFASALGHKGRTKLQSFGRFRVVAFIPAILFRALERRECCEIHFCGPSMRGNSGPQVYVHIWTRSVPIRFTVS